MTLLKPARTLWDIITTTCSKVSWLASQSLQRSSRDLSRQTFSRSAASDFRLRPLLTGVRLRRQTVVLDLNKKKSHSQQLRCSPSVPLSQSKVAQIDCARQRQAVVARQSLAVLVAADADFQDMWVSQDLDEAEGKWLLSAAKRLQPHQDAQTRIRGHLQQGDGRGSAFHRHLRQKGQSVRM